MAERYSLLPVVTGNPYPQNTARHAAYEAGRASLAVSAGSGPLMGQPQEMPDLSALTERGAKAWAGVDAHGLRAGVAPVAANAGSEPVAWTGGEEWEQLAWHLCAEEHGEDACDELIWEGGPIPEPWGYRWMKYESDAKRMIELVRRFYTHPSPPEGMVGGWISVEDRLPKLYTEVLIHPRPTAYCCEGEVDTQGRWSYGEYETGFGHHQIACEVTHWMPLPPPPTTSAGSGKGE